MLEAVLFLSVGMISTLFVGCAGKFLSTYIVDKDLSPVVGFSLAIGFVLAGGFRGVETNSDLQYTWLSLGMFAGLALMWFRFFKRPQAER